MDIVAALLVLLLLLAPLGLVAYLFLWAAKKDGAEDNAVQQKLGRRSTRLGR
jgi:hypothetical protein